MRLHLRSLMAVFAIAACVSPVTRSGDITFDFSTADFEDSDLTISRTVAGVTLTLLNPVGNSTFWTDDDGVYIGALPTDTIPYGFDMQVSGSELSFKTYVVGWVGLSDATITGGPTSPFSLTGGTGVSTGNSMAALGTYNFAGPYTISPGQTVTLMSSLIPGRNFNQILSMTFSTVPEPSTYALGAIATGVMAAVARRRKVKIA